MTIAQSSIEGIAEALSVDFNVFLQDTYGLELNELLATAASRFLDEELGEIDDDLFYDLALELIQRTSF